MKSKSDKSILGIDFLALIAAVALITIPSHASATVAYSSLTSGTYSNNSYAVMGAQTHWSGYSSWGAAFVASASGNLSSIDLGVTYYTDLASHNAYDSEFLVELAASGTDGSPSSLLALSGGLSPAQLEDTSANPPLSGYSLTTFVWSGAAISLTAGTTYWILVLPYGGYSAMDWNLGSPSVSGTVDASAVAGGAYSYNNSAYEPAYQVNVATVPEPVTSLEAVAGAVALLGIYRRRKTNS